MLPHHPSLRRISDCFVKPDCLPQESKQPYYLNLWDLTMLSVNYIQKGLLFLKPSEAYGDPHNFMLTLLHRLKNSLSTALFHFYPLTGRFCTANNHIDGQASIFIYVDCINSPGAKFTHAALDATISDILSPNDDEPLLLQSLFDLNGAVNYDAHTLPILSIQVTELLDGIFIGSSLNHSIGDGTSHWNFFRTWSEIFNDVPISRAPILKQWFPKGYGPIINLPFTHPDQFISRSVSVAPQKLRERVFHFSKESIAKLKARANAECGTNEISSFQALCALVWRSITRARSVAEDQSSSCKLFANNRGRLEPPLCEDHFGNIVTAVKAEAKAGELVEAGVGWGAWKLHEAVVDNKYEKLREEVEKWLQSPSFHRFGEGMDPYAVVITSSPRFKIYENEFGMGKAMGVRSGCGNKFDGKATSYPGRDGGGSVDLEITLLPKNMANLESNTEFMASVSYSSPPHLHHHC
ncbi:uncharacterized acetyltransferase At3g50280-like [Momordica charantia]|uniref:Uncharacterized acetyltransferase At3g50280-like n=1 Tax=Momordica charantia TaxID=3673 RepID=A0A6J1D638_MOMCH|nr:uncharacterized acetyltransferase At3g50280-like [Momordica charantia]